jgi:hypothetical protein
VCDEGSESWVAGTVVTDSGDMAVTKSVGVWNRELQDDTAPCASYARCWWSFQRWWGPLWCVTWQMRGSGRGWNGLGRNRGQAGVRRRDVWGIMGGCEWQKG